MRLAVGYPGSARIDHARRDLDAMASAGVTAVVLEASEEDALEHPDRLAGLVAEARDRALEVRVAPRGVLGLFAGGGASLAVAREPSLRQRLTDGTFVPAACPNDHGTGAWLERWLASVLAARPDAVAWVEPRLWVALRDPLHAGRRDAWSCACERCVEAWALGRHDAPGSAMPAGFTAEVRDFRRRSLIGLLEPGFARVQRAGLRNVVTVTPVTGDHPEALPWDALVALAYVDGLGTDACDEVGPAAADEASFWASRVVRTARAARGRVATHVRFRTDRIRAGREQHLAAAVAAARAAGVEEILVRAWPDAEPQARGDRSSSGAPATLPAVDAWRVIAGGALDAGGAARAGPA